VRVAAAIGVFAAMVAVAIVQLARSRPPEIAPEVPYVSTPPKVVDAMLAMAAVQQGELVYDLGCGDGRIVIQAAKGHGARGVGVDIDPRLVELARRNASDAGVADRVEFRQQDLFEMDLRDADVVALYLGQAINLRLRPRLLDQLRPGARIVSHAFDMGRWEPRRVERVNGATAYLWVVPDEVPPSLRTFSYDEQRAMGAVP
jgi:cyclopropane fatty-acyl-phospholipid synthase-like methyltransferase